MDHFISMYIDNELSLAEKILFVKQCHGNKQYADEAVSLLQQEKKLTTALHHTAPKVTFSPTPDNKLLLSPASLGWAIAACLLVVLSFTVPKNISLPVQKKVVHQATSERRHVPYRFVILQQDTQSVEITGSFTNWQAVPLSPTGSAGYWEVNLNLPVGEHRYTYIIDGSTYLPDPTLPSQESDDFGSTNTILQIKA